MALDPIFDHESFNKTELTQRLLNEYQHNFPVTSTPYADIAERLGVDEQTILDFA